MKFEIDQKSALKNIENDSDYIEKIIVPNGVKVIETKSFNKVKYVKEIVLPQSLEVIKSSAFCNLVSLKSIELPSALKTLEVSTFDGCKSLEKIILPKDIENIEDYAFSRCENIKKIKIPILIKEISKGLFLECENLDNIQLNDNITTIKKIAFSKCKNLKSIKLPLSLKKIESGAFSDSGLRKIKIPNTVTELGEKAFFNCDKLTEVILPSSLKELKSNTFGNCYKLKRVIMPETIEQIADRTFMQCNSLENIKLPKSLKYIGTNAFTLCTNLKQLDIPPYVEKIDELAFHGCKNLQKITIPPSLKEIHQNSISNCPNLKEIKLGNIFQIKETIKESFFKYYYYNDETMEFIESVEEKKNLKGYRKIDIVTTCEKFECGILEAVFIDALFNKLSSNLSEEVKSLLPLLIQDIDINNYRQIIEIIDNSKEFINLLKKLEVARSKLGTGRIRAIYDYDFFKLANSLGAFSSNKIQRQRACEFLHNAIDKKYLRYHYIHRDFESIKFKPYNDEWAQFLMNKDNFKQLLNMEKDYDWHGIISRIHNDFENIKEFGRSNRGEQRYRKITINMAKEYFEKASFANVNINNEDIANTIRKYTRNQESFDDASSIREEYLKLKEADKINNHILGEELKEVRKEIIENSHDSLNSLNEVCNNNFTYEYLSKYDPNNFVLGKYCSCCSHLEGAGYSIMKASILHPDCQNIIIRDKSGQIVAKSTLYINRQQGYGVCNNVEVNAKIKQSQKEMIYTKYIEAIEAFAKKYNQKNTAVPIKQINVGMNLNDLDSFIKTNHDKSKDILKGISFYKYGKRGQAYNGDWQEEQYVIYSKSKSDKKR